MKSRHVFAMLMIGLVCMLAVPRGFAVTPTLYQGTRTLNVYGSIDDDGDDLGISLGLRTGYFMEDFIQAGVFGSFEIRGSDHTWFSAGVFGEYNLYTGSQLVPYVGGSLGLGYWDNPWDDEIFLEIQALGGARYFFIDYAAIGSEFVLKAATEDIYNHGQDSVDWVIRLFTSWYF